jgi:hypothetical protein
MPKFRPIKRLVDIGPLLRRARDAGWKVSVVDRATVKLTREADTMLVSAALVRPESRRLLEAELSRRGY